MVTAHHTRFLVARHASIPTPKSLSPPFAARSKPLSAPARPLWGQRFGSRLRAARGLTPQPQRKPTQLPRLMVNRSNWPRSRLCLAAALAGRSGPSSDSQPEGQPSPLHRIPLRGRASGPRRHPWASPESLAFTSHSALSHSVTVAVLPPRCRKCSEWCAVSCSSAGAPSARPRRASGHARGPRPRPRTSFAACPRRSAPAGRVSSVLRVASRRVAVPPPAGAALHGTKRRSLRLRGAAAGAFSASVASRRPRRTAPPLGFPLLRAARAAKPRSRRRGQSAAPARGVKRRPARTHP